MAILMDGHQTERLYFRPVNLDDVAPWMEFMNSEKALEFFEFQVGSQEDCEKWINKQLKRYEQFGHGAMALINKETEEMVGLCGLLVQDVEGEQELEIGYTVIPRFWGQGYAPEAAIACKEYAFRNSLNSHLISLIHIHNIKSQKVAQKNGMQIWKQATFMKQPVDVWRVTREEWQGIS